MRIADLRQKEVINIRDGTRFGYLHDVELDIYNGFIQTIIIPAPGKLFGFFQKDDEYHIPWESIKRIGDDIILVDVDVVRDRITLDPM